MLLLQPMYFVVTAIRVIWSIVCIPFSTESAIFLLLCKQQCKCQVRSHLYRRITPFYTHLEFSDNTLKKWYKQVSDNVLCYTKRTTCWYALLSSPRTSGIIRVESNRLCLDEGILDEGKDQSPISRSGWSVIVDTVDCYSHTPLGEYCWTACCATVQQVRRRVEYDYYLL